MVDVHHYCICLREEPGHEGLEERFWWVETVQQAEGGEGHGTGADECDLLGWRGVYGLEGGELEAC